MLASLACFVTPATSHAQSYPDKPIRLIAPFPPGGGTDLMGHLISQHINRQWGQPVVVENKPGANGMIGSEFVARAPADGYTLLVGTMGTHGINASLYRKLPYDTVADFAPITELISSPMMLLVHPSVPARSVKDFIALAKARPGQLTFSSAGIGSVGHLAGEWFNAMAQVKTLHVPYKGSGPATVDLLSGHVQAMLGSPAAAAGFVKSNKVRALAVTSIKRSSLMPDIPTVAESGLRGYDVTTWYGLWAPAQTPRSIVSRWHGEIVRMLALPSTTQQLSTQGLEAVGNTPEQFAAQIKLELQKWARVAASAGIVPE
ncbi:MAG TPA: tripartite tricarboxylate transporter substrate binding protein [Burkholderiales bacterium]|nr:tripartite tricarboxylate transporter substrate binding protein [Burkholderiales bacterium]